MAPRPKPTIRGRPRVTPNEDGHGAAGRAGAYFSQQSASHEFIPSGCQLLDCVLGGGYVLGRITNIVGDKSTGKTLLAIEACANFLRLYPQGQVLYIEAEAAFDVAYARALGLPEKGLKLIQDVDTVEQLFTHLYQFVNPEQRRNCPGLVIVDSLDSLSDKAESERQFDEGSYGTGKARKMSELFRRLARKLNQAQVCVIIISQVRDAIGVTFGRKTTRTGGRALDFYASQVLYLAQIETLKKTINKVLRPVGVRIKAKADKNKISLPFRECEFNIRFGYGIDDVLACLEWLEEVRRLKEVGLSEGEVEKTVKKMEDLETSDFEELRATVATAVKQVWSEIEVEFLPRRLKYRAPA